jgi:hypothetical protein
MTMDKPHNVPSDVTVEEGEVMVDGPDGVAVSFTPSAAEETSHRLLDGAAKAAGEDSRRKTEDAERRTRRS